MCLRLSRLRSDRGNSVLEFVGFFAAGLIVVFALSANFESELRARMAALSMSNEALRVWQISDDVQQAKTAASQTAVTFLLDQNSWQIRFEDSCASGNQRFVESKVGRVIEVAQGNC